MKWRHGLLQFAVAFPLIAISSMADAEVDPCTLLDEAAMGQLGLAQRTSTKERKQEPLPAPKSGTRTVNTCRNVAPGRDLPTLVMAVGRPGKEGHSKPLNCISKSLFGLHTVSCALIQPDEDRVWIYVYRAADMPDAETRFRREVARAIAAAQPTGRQ